MSNQNALISTAMLAAIWEKEKKDTIELILPFVMYAIGKTTSIDNKIDVDQVASFLSDNFGFQEIPYSVLQKTFIRLRKKAILEQKDYKLYLCKDLSDLCQKVDLQQSQTTTHTASVIEALTKYLNSKKERFFGKDISNEQTQTFFARFLESNGYLIYVEIAKLREISAHESTLNYHIAQFIIAEHEKKSELFAYINNIVKGFLLSRVIYGYADLQYDEKFKDVCMFMDTTLLLHIFGFKGNEDNKAAKQMVEILKGNAVPIRCFKHNYSEIHRIIEAYRHNVHNPINRYGQTLEHFDKLGYSVSDMDRVLVNLEEYFREQDIDIVDTPSLSSDGTGVIAPADFSSSIGEIELKEHLSKLMSYGSDDALNNDVTSIASIYALRKGEEYQKIEKCKALFVTTNKKLAYAAQKFVGYQESSIPLVIDDLELTTLLWLKNYKRFSDLPTLKLIEVAQLSLEPTEQIRTEFHKKIRQLESEPAVTEEKAASYRQLIYTEKEKIMELISASPDNISKIQLSDLEQLSREHYNSLLSDENQSLKDRLSATEEKLWAEANEKINNAGKWTANIIKTIIYIIIAALFFIGVKGIFSQEFVNNISWFAGIFSLLGVIGLVDTISPRLYFVNKGVTILANKRMAHVRKKEQERICKIIGNLED